MPADRDVGEDPGSLVPNVQGEAKRFAAAINPTQEKPLWEMTDLLEIAGAFTAGMDVVGRTYSVADRKPMFPSVAG